MDLPRWLRQIHRRFRDSHREEAERPRSPRSGRTLPRHSVRPRLEALEDRITPSTAGNAAELAMVIQQDNTNNTADTITLTADIQLTAQLTITDKAGLTIQGQGHTIDASGAHNRAFLIDNGGTSVVFQNLTIKGGVATDDGTGTSNTDARGGGILDNGGDVTLSHVVLQSNKAQAGTGHDADGGGIYVESGSLTIKSSVIQNNEADGGAGGGATPIGGSGLGGGIYTAGTTNLIDSSVVSNVVTGGSASGAGGFGGKASGGGIYAQDEPLTITDSTVSNNSLVGGNSGNAGGGRAYGGGLYIYALTAKIFNSNLSGNTLTGGDGGTVGDNLSTLGGAVFGGAIYNNGTLTVSASILSDNTLTGGKGNVQGNASLHGDDIGGDAEGGGIYTFSSTTLTISDSILSHNTLTGGAGSISDNITLSSTVGGAALGGGLYGYTTILRDSTVSDNSITSGSASGPSAAPGLARGGGAYLAGPGNLLLNATVADNRANGGDGGGLYFASTATATLTNDTVSGNDATLQIGKQGGHGGGIENDGGSVTLVNSLVAHNNATTNTPDYTGFVSNSSHNLIGNADNSTGFSTANGDQLGTLFNPIDPHLGPLQDNGGVSAGAPGSQQVVPTMALLPGSPALGAGDPALAPSTDQRGVPRPAGGPTDVGSVQVSQVTTSPPGSPPGSPPASPPSPPAPSLLSAILGLYIAEVEKDLGFGDPTALQQTIDFDARYTVIFGINIAPFIEQMADTNVARARAGNS